MFSNISIAIFSLLLFLMSGCKNEVVVVYEHWNDQGITLSQKQARWFVKDISGPGLRSNISAYPAEPCAYFDYAGKKYLMHGNAVIHVQPDGKEYLWTGPYLQALISEGSKITEAVKKIEKRENLDGIKLDAPGAYPGGGPAPLIEDK